MTRRDVATVRIAAGLPADAALLRLGASVFAVHIWALGYCAREESDGRIPDAAVAECPWPDVEKSASALVDARLWKRRRGGFEVPAFLELNESRERAEQRRRLARERQARARGADTAALEPGAAAPPEWQPLAGAAPAQAEPASLVDALRDWLQRGGFGLPDRALDMEIDDLQADRPGERLSPADRVRLLARRQELRLQASRYVVPAPVPRPVTPGVRSPCADIKDEDHRTGFSAGQLQACIDSSGCERCAAEIVRRGEEELRLRQA